MWSPIGTSIFDHKTINLIYVKEFNRRFQVFVSVRPHAQNEVRVRIGLKIQTSVPYLMFQHCLYYCVSHKKTFKKKSFEGTCSPGIEYRPSQLANECLVVSPPHWFLYIYGNYFKLIAWVNVIALFSVRVRLCVLILVT